MQRIAQPVEGGGTGAAALRNLALGALAATQSPRARRALAGYTIGSAAWEVGKRWYDERVGQRTYTVTVRGSDDLYLDVHRWLLESLSSTARRALTARTERLHSSMEAVPAGTPEQAPRARVDLLYDGAGQQVVTLDGHRITVNVNRPDLGTSVLSMKESDRLPAYLADAETTMFTATSEAGRDAVIALLNLLTFKRHSGDRKPEFHMASRWGGWDRRADIPVRDLDTVVLAGSQKEDLVADLGQFFADEAAYNKLGLPWHRGYLLHGPPGTGKTSIAKAVANHFGLDIWYIPLSDMSADANLLQLVSQVRPGGMLLLEDVDISKMTKSRGDGGEDDGEDDEVSIAPHATLSGLLNALDGVSTPHGLVTVMTTNRDAVLDEALIRPGRVDLDLEIGYVDADQVSRMFEAFYGWKPSVATVSRKVTPAQIVGIVKRNLHDREAAAAEIAELIGDVERVAA